MKCIFGQLIYYIFEELIVRRLHFEYHSCGFLVCMRKVCSYNVHIMGVLLIKAFVYSDILLVFHIFRKREPFKLFE